MKNTKPKANNPNRQRRFAPATCYAPLVILPTTTSAENLAEIKAAGYVVVMCDEPEKVVVKLPHTPSEGGDMLMAAMHGLVSGGYTPPMEKFVKELHARMLKSEGA